MAALFDMLKTNRTITDLKFMGNVRNSSDGMLGAMSMQHGEGCVEQLAET